MIDQRAALFAKLLAEYARSCAMENGVSLDEVADYTLRVTAIDLQTSHPQYLPPLPSEIAALAGDGEAAPAPSTGVADQLDRAIRAALDSSDPNVNSELGVRLMLDTINRERIGA